MAAALEPLLDDLKKGAEVAAKMAELIDLPGFATFDVDGSQVATTEAKRVKAHQVTQIDDFTPQIRCVTNPSRFAGHVWTGNSVEQMLPIKSSIGLID